MTTKKLSNRKRLEKAKVLKKDAGLTPAQEEAIEELSAEEIELLLAVKNKLKDVFPPTELASPITHHH